MSRMGPGRDDVTSVGTSNQTITTWIERELKNLRDYAVKRKADGVIDENRDKLAKSGSGERDLALAVRPLDSLANWYGAVGCVAVLTYSAPKTEVEADGSGVLQTKTVGTEYGLQMRRMIAGRPFKCTAGTIRTPEGLDPVIAACKSVRPL